MDILISANALKESIITERNYITPDNAHDIGMCNGLSLAHALVLIAPTVDAVEVVRCKDCKHYKSITCSCGCHCVSDNWYCADGERKEND